MLELMETIAGNTGCPKKRTKWFYQSIEKLIPLKYCPSIATSVTANITYLGSSYSHKVGATAPAVPLAFTQ